MSRNMIRMASLVLLAAVAAISIILFLIAGKTTAVLDEKDERLKTFFANASHELKTPLMAIQGYTEGMQEGIVSSDQALPVIRKETGRMSRLVEDILKLSKADSGELKPQMYKNDLREILYDCIEDIFAQVERKNLNLQFDLPEPCFVTCDE